MQMERRASFGWSSTSPAGYATPTLGLVVHYDGSNQGLAGKGHSACRAYWKRTRTFHTGPSRRWADIGYSFGVCPHGIVLEGRGLNRVQAAQPGGNATWYSVTFMSGPSESPTGSQLTAFRQLRAYLMGRGVRGTVSYHGRFVSTSCAGTILNAMVSSGAILKGETGGSNPPPSGGGGRVLRRGASGADVTAVQAQLVFLGYDVGTHGADGRFGADTERAVRAFQSAEGIGVDGAVGNQTRAALNAAVEREREQVPERTSYTMSGGYRQVIAPDEWTTVRWDRRWDGQKWLDKKAEPSIVFGPSMFTSTVGLRVQGLEQGGELQVRYAFYREGADGWERYATMPINSPTHDIGALHSITSWSGQVSGSKRGRVRVEVNHFRRDGQEVAITGGRVDSLYWKV